MEQKLDLIIQMIKNQDKKIDSLDFKIDSVKEEMNGQYDSLREEMNGQYDSLREEMNGQYDSLREEMNGKYDSLKGTVSSIEQKLDNLSNQVTLLEDYAHDKCEGALDGWVSHLQIQEEIKNNVTNLNSKTENHEIRISVLEDALEV